MSNAHASAHDCLHGSKIGRLCCACRKRRLPEATYHFGAHGVAGAEGECVDDLVAHVAVLCHAGGVLGQALGVDHAIEVVRRLQCHLDVVAVAFDVHVRRLTAICE